MKILILASSFILTACTAQHIPQPYNASEGWEHSIPEYWPDDGWKPPPMHEPAEIMRINLISHHICEFTNKAECAD